VSPKGPDNADVVQELVKSRIAASGERQQMQSTLEVTWRGGQISLPTISMPLDHLRYNPETHRIKAQRDFDPAGDKAIRDRPWDSAAQDYLGRLLPGLPIDPSRIDPAFVKLQDDLKTYGQKDPGIITPDGILINGNSRCAALRGIGAKDMRVAVLPSDWTWDDIALVELDLQMRRDHRRDYSFINLLLALQESVDAAGADNAARAFRLQRPTVDRNLWILAVLQDLVDRSRVEGLDQSLNLRDFETDQGKLEELHRTYSKLYKSDPTAADRLRDARLVALLLDKSKTDLRFVGDTFLADYLSKTLSTELMDDPIEEPEVEIPGLSGNVAAPIKREGFSLVDRLAQAKTMLKSDDEQTKASAAAFVKEIDVAVERAINSAGRDERLKKKSSAAVDKLTLATDTLESTIADIAEAKSKGALDEDALNEALVTFEEVLGRLGRTILRVVEAEGDGFAWLTRSVTRDDSQR
jgi:hypothetical protein